MNTLQQRLPLVVAIICATTFSQAQSALAYQGNTAYHAAQKEAVAAHTAHRSYKKLPALYEGYGIEVATAAYPLDGTAPVFRKFGNIHYDKLERGSYSYLILGKFSDNGSALHFLNNVIAPQVPKAKLVLYKDGIRMIVREEQ